MILHEFHQKNYLNKTNTHIKVLANNNEINNVLYSKDKNVEIMKQYVYSEEHIASVYLADTAGNFLQLRRNPKLAVRTIETIDDKRVELVISDNISDDGTFEKISSITCDDIRVFRPKESLSPFDNHKFALSQAQGQFVFPLGGDDYISPDCLKYILDILKPGRIVVPVTRCFKDKTNAFF